MKKYVKTADNSNFETFQASIKCKTTTSVHQKRRYLCTKFFKELGRYSSMEKAAKPPTLRTLLIRTLLLIPYGIEYKKYLGDAVVCLEWLA
jgi:hypothetical protein